MIGDFENSLQEEPQTREQQVLFYAAQGMTDKEIAHRLGISRETVLTYWRRIRLRHGSASRTEVVAKSLQIKASEKINEVEDHNQRLLFEIAERKRMELLLVQASSRLRTLMDALHSGVLFEDDAGRVSFVNHAFCTMFDIPFRPKEYVGQEHKNLIQRAKKVFTDGNAFADRVTELERLGEPVREERFELIDGRVFALDYLPIDPSASVQGHLWHFRDVTDTAHIHRRLDEHREKRRFVSEMGAELILVTNDAARSTVAAYLERLGTSAGADRAYVSLAGPDGREADAIQWCAPGIEPKESCVPKYKGSQKAWWLQRLHDSSVVNVDAIENMPGDATDEKAALDQSHVRSLMLVPVSAEGRFVGYIGLEAVREPQRWDEEVSSLLEDTGRLVSALFRRPEATRTERSA
ncbi:MAG: PAS domain-containing protein [Fimbriimonadaceae bacterium]|nr:PAS domain-containing protein [Fimbriimonadaceae bacterium]